ncbi:transposase [Sulfitobacter sediminilitoris]|uniref:transposase n=1 Tax=Sulfitobacter sediminilitoris TaxID=2698830 RepID=UPI001953777C
MDALIAPWVIRGAMDGPAFAAYLRQVLVPEIAPRTVVIRANLASDRNKEAAEVLRAHGCWFLYLPPYSPDLSPIEQAFSKLKAHLRWIDARTFTDVFHPIGTICDLHEPQECWNCFKAAGYA